MHCHENLHRTDKALLLSTIKTIKEQFMGPVNLIGVRRCIQRHASICARSEVIVKYD